VGHASGLWSRVGGINYADIKCYLFHQNLAAKLIYYFKLFYCMRRVRGRTACRLAQEAMAVCTAGSVAASLAG
jgi:hypothetical protein